MPEQIFDIPEYIEASLCLFTFSNFLLIHVNCCFGLIFMAQVLVRLSRYCVGVTRNLDIWSPAPEKLNRLNALQQNTKTDESISKYKIIRAVTHFYDEIVSICVWILSIKHK